MNLDFSRVIPFAIKLAFSLGFIGFLIIMAKIVAGRVRHSVQTSDIETNAYNERLADLMGDVTYRGIITFAVMIFFQMMGINIGFLITWLTFGIGFAIKEILGNMFAWLMILTNKKFTIGDIVQFEGWLDYFGKILEISIRHTIIQTFDHRKVIVPNIILVSNFVKTFSAEQIIKTDVSIDVWFQDDPIAVCEIIRNYLNEKDFIVEKNATKVLITWVFDSWYSLKMFFYMKPKWKQWLLVAKSLIKKELLWFFDKQGRTYPRDHIAITTDRADPGLQWLGQQLRTTT
jgi:small-conductance mechanosensitive channel